MLYALFDCKGNMIATYKTEKGLAIGQTKRAFALWGIYNATPVNERKETNLIYYSKIIDCNGNVIS